jgi:hypothetical protein
MCESRQCLNKRRLAGILGFTEARGLARVDQRPVVRPSEQFPPGYGRRAVRGGQSAGPANIDFVRLT